MMRVAVVGAGSYGTCLAILLASSGHEVTLWCRGEELAEQMRGSGENAVYLPGYALPAAIEVTTDLTAAVAHKQLVLGVTPSHAIRQVLGAVAAHLDPDVVVVNASKGLEEGTLDTIDRIYADIFPPAIAARAQYLSGPTFAKEIAAGLPAAIVLAGRELDAVRRVQEELSCDWLRVYTSDDVTGVLIGGALKNVVAIAAGLSDGLGFGLNARAALITRGLAEITRIGAAMGANPLTFAGLSGMGDLVLTCSGDLSRNRRVGLALGQGKRLDEIVSEMRMVAEGVKTTKVAHALARAQGVPAPLTSFMHAVLYEGREAREGIARLMRRPLKDERA